MPSLHITLIDHLLDVSSTPRGRKWVQSLAKCCRCDSYLGFTRDRVARSRACKRLPEKSRFSPFVCGQEEPRWMTDAYVATTSPFVALFIRYWLIMKRFFSP